MNLFARTARKHRLPDLCLAALSRLSEISGSMAKDKEPGIASDDFVRVGDDFACSVVRRKESPLT